MTPLVAAASYRWPSSETKAGSSRLRLARCDRKRRGTIAAAEDDNAPWSPGGDCRDDHRVAVGDRNDSRSSGWSWAWRRSCIGRREHRRTGSARIGRSGSDSHTLRQSGAGPGHPPGPRPDGHFDRRSSRGWRSWTSSGSPGVRPRASRSQLDTRGLTIVNVGTRTSKADPLKPFTPAAFQLGPADPILGSRLTHPARPPETKQVRIAYRTAPVGQCPPVAGAVADGGQGPAVPVHAVGGDPRPVVDPAPGLAGRADHLCRRSSGCRRA